MPEDTDTEHDPLSFYPTDPETQKQWLEESIASRLADLKAQYE